MFERLAKTKALLETPKNKKMKRFIDTSIAANGPLLEEVRKRLAEHKNMSLTIDSMLNQELKFGTRMPKNLLFVAREVALAWDSVLREERKEAGLHADLCNQSSYISTLFSNAKRGNKSFGILLDDAETKKSMIRRWKLLMGLQHGTVPFEKVQDFFLNEAKESLKLSSFEVNGDELSIVGVWMVPDITTGEKEEVPGEIRLKHRNVYAHISDYEGMLAALKEAAATRLIVGYSPLVH